MRPVAVALSAMLALLALVSVSVADVPLVINHQGILLDDDGLPMERSVTLEFSLYSAAEGGVSIWSEEYQVDLVDGYYSLLLGQQNDLGVLRGPGARYLGVRVDHADDELAPRLQLASVPYALVADNAVGALTPTSVEVQAGGTISVGGMVVIDAQGQWRGSDVPGDTVMDGSIDMTNHGINNLDYLHINDPGPDGRIYWGGSQAQIYVAPLNDDNADGYLRVRNDEGISLESDVRATGALTVAGSVAIGAGAPAAALGVRDDSAVSTGLHVRNWRAGSNTRPYLKLEGTTPDDQGAWGMIQAVTGVEAGGQNAANHGGLQLVVSTGGAGTPNTAMTVEHTGNVGIGTEDPASRLHVARADHLNVILDRTDTSDHLTAVVGSNGSGLSFSDSNFFFVGTQPYEERNDTSGGTELLRITPDRKTTLRGQLDVADIVTMRTGSVVRRKGVLSFVHPAGGYPAGQEWAQRYYHIRTPDLRRNEEMYRYDLTGYSYGIAQPLSFTWVGYIYGGSGTIIQDRTTNNTSNGVGVTHYLGSDDHLYLKFGPISQYFNSFVLDYQSGSTGERVDHGAGGYTIILRADAGNQ